jgi:TolB protein
LPITAKTSQSDVAFGSNAVLSPCQSHVRYTANSGADTDIPALRTSASSGLCHNLAANWANPLSPMYPELPFRSFSRTTRRHVAVFGAAAIGSVLGLTHPSNAQGGLPDTSPKVLSLAVPDLESPSPDNAGLAHLIAKTIIDDLRGSGGFLPVDLTNISVAVSSFDSLPKFDAWRSAGVQVLISGRIRSVDKKLRTDFFIWDVVSHNAIQGQSYTGWPDQWQLMAHSMSSVVYQHFTGEQRDFVSR